MNILPLVMQFFGPVIVNKIAGALGINSTVAQKAIAYAAPAILAGLVNKVSQPGVAKVLADTITKQDGNILGKLTEMIGTGRQGQLVEQGTSALGALLGNGLLGSLAGALSKQAGVGVGAANTLLGLMTPAVLGTLGREQKKEGLDAAGLGNALLAQKQQIADAIPADFAKLLSGTGLLDAIQGKVNGTPAAVAKPAATATTAGATTASAREPASRPASAPAAAAGSATHHHHFNWWPWLIAIAAASGMWWSVFGEKLLTPQHSVRIPAVISPPTTLATAPVPMAPIIANTDVGKQLVSLVGDIKGAVAGVRDTATAQAALPRIQEAAGRLEKLNMQAGQLSGDARRALATYVASEQGVIKSTIASVLALPGVSAVLKPVLEQMQGRIEGLAKG